MMFQPPIDPFPPTIEEGLAILQIGFLFGHFLVLILMLVLMLYCYMKVKDFLPILVIYSFSLILGMEFIVHLHIPFGPLLEIFFMVFQSTIFLMSALDLQEKNKNKNKNKR